MSDNIITQVSPETYTPLDKGGSGDYNSKINLNIRGKQFIITRDELMSLPESILLCLFPNGVFMDKNNQVISNLTENDEVYVNFEPSCFEYILSTFTDAQSELSDLVPVTTKENILHNKPAIIVLREDLDFYLIPPSQGLSAQEMKSLKLSVSRELIKNDLLFSGLGYDFNSPDQTLGPAEQHLFDMLCSSGFEKNGEWGSRSLEPNRCVISSLSLVRLKNQQPEQDSSLEVVQSNSSRSRSRLAEITTAARAASRSLSRSRKNVDQNHNKLLLFWRKPARKCWWSNEVVEINFNKNPIKVKVHTRRVWTLELSVIGVQ